MNISEFCIKRPVFTILLMAAICVLGISGYLGLPISSLPNIDFPTISVTARLPGASPETMASTVAQPLEKQFSTIAGLTSMTSTNFLGSSQITLQFDLDRDIDAAALDVQIALAAVARRLPTEMPTPPSFSKVNPADQPILFIAMHSDALPASQLSEYADNTLAPRISTLPGVSQVNVYGMRKYALRIQVDPDKLAFLDLSLDEVSNILSKAVSNAPLGYISGNKQLFYLEIAGQPKSPAEFMDLIALWRNGSPIRVSDIATVVDSVEDTKSDGFLKDSKGVVLAIQRQQNANTIEVVDQIRELLPNFRAQLPPTISLEPMFDRSVSIRNTVHEVQLTLVLTIALVIGVIYLFLGNIRSTIIPSLAVPFSIIATYGGMKYFGYSINNISLLAIILCVGLVVDDAIVMLENITRYIEKGEPIYEAALKGSKEVGFTIISISLSLVAVFIPVLFMGGVIGKLFKEFAVTISFAILVSGLVSLTLTPMLCSRMLKPEKTGLKTNKFEKYYSAAKQYYSICLLEVIKNKHIWLIATIAMLGASIALYIVAPKGFFPSEDTGFIYIQTEGSQDISYDAMLEKQKQLVELIAKDKDVTTMFHTLGGGRGSFNSGRIFVSLKPSAQRDSVFKVIERLRKSAVLVPNINAYLQPVQNLRIGGRLTKSMYQYVLQSADITGLFDYSEKFTVRLAREKGFKNVNSDLQLKSLQVKINVNPIRAAQQGITYDQVRQALYSAFGNRQIGSLYTQTDVYQIILEVMPQFQEDPADLSHIYLKNSNNEIIKLDSIARMEKSNAPLVINHQDQLPSVNISFDLNDGYPLSSAITAIKNIEKEMKTNSDLIGKFQGNAQVFASSAAGQGLLLLLSIIVIYIILGMLYESFIHPITIISGLPSAGIGAILSLMLFGMELDVMGIIGIVLLIGLVKKNAIMMVDFAITLRSKGMTAHDAIYQACMLRFRPIMMTTMAALIGTLPIAFAFGAGAEIRQPLGIAVIGGLLVSQLLTLFITPVIYIYLDRFNRSI